MSDGLHNSTVLLEIQVTDVNDGSPAFNSTIEYSARVAEVCWSPSPFLQFAFKGVVLIRNMLFRPHYILQALQETVYFKFCFHIFLSINTVSFLPDSRIVTKGKLVCCIGLWFETFLDLLFFVIHIAKNIPFNSLKDRMICTVKR